MLEGTFRMGENKDAGGPRLCLSRVEPRYSHVGGRALCRVPLELQAAAFGPRGALIPHETPSSEPRRACFWTPGAAAWVASTS